LNVEGSKPSEDDWIISWPLVSADPKAPVGIQDVANAPLSICKYWTVPDTSTLMLAEVAVKVTLDLTGYAPEPLRITLAAPVIVTFPVP
jgi:hypothetical protein